MRTRITDLIHRLLTIDYPISIDQLALDMSTSVRTVRNDLNEINSFLTNLGIETVQTIRGKGILLKLPPEAKQQVITQLKESRSHYYTREERSFDLLLHLTFSTAPLFLNKKEVEYQISKSSMDEDMRRLRLEINKYGLEIISLGKKGLQLNGSERAKRTMIFDIINQRIGIIDLINDHQDAILYQLLFSYLDENVFDTINQLMKQTMGQKQNDLYSSQILLFAAIWIKRLKMNAFITMVNWLPADFRDQDSSSIIGALLSSIGALLSSFDLDPP